MSAEEMKLSMYRTWVQNRGNSHIPTHYIIGVSWDMVQVNELSYPVWAVAKDKYNTIEDVQKANLWGVHIEMVGDFNKHKPTEKQYETLRKLVKELQATHTGMQIRYHSDFQHKNCVGEKFDREFMNEKKTIEFSLSRYYSPVKWQSRYYDWKTYEQDVTTNCGASAINNDDCLYPANWMLLKQEHKNKVVACPMEYEKWTKIYLEWIWVVTCVDRWWAIVWNRLDIYCWIWEYALDNWETCKTWIRKWYIVK